MCIVYLLFLCPRATASAIGLYPESDSMVISAPLAKLESDRKLVTQFKKISRIYNDLKTCTVPSNASTHLIWFPRTA